MAAIDAQVMTELDRADLSHRDAIQQMEAMTREDAVPVYIGEPIRRDVQVDQPLYEPSLWYLRMQTSSEPESHRLDQRRTDDTQHAPDECDSAIVGTGVRHHDDQVSARRYPRGQLVDQCRGRAGDQVQHAVGQYQVGRIDSHGAIVADQPRHALVVQAHSCRRDVRRGDVDPREGGQRRDAMQVRDGLARSAADVHDPERPVGFNDRTNDVEDGSSARHVGAETPVLQVDGRCHRATMAPIMFDGTLRSPASYRKWDATGYPISHRVMP